MFQANSADLQYIFDEAGQTVLINDDVTNVVLTNPPISEYEERFLHSTETVLQGDIVMLDNERYLVITESISKRSSKYKVLIRHCNHTIEVPGEVEQVLIGHDHLGRPVYDYIEGEPIIIPAIVDNKSFSVDGTSQFRVPDNQIIAIVQDNELNREKFAINSTFTFEGNYKVLHRDFTKRGLMILTCEKVA